MRSTLPLTVILVSFAANNGNSQGVMSSPCTKCVGKSVTSDPVSNMAKHERPLSDKRRYVGKPFELSPSAALTMFTTCVPVVVELPC